ncbi:uncharacterized protein LOC143297497 [Babylonia areolata]|uniref:uncharacterized protein LOC143297497 n=1 Tax=Babylonia areolata TaxID=304850 RepID=UPI003FD0BA17
MVFGVGRSQVACLESDSWNQFLEKLQRPRGSRIAPMLTVEQNTITICDVATNISSTHRAVIDFLYRRVTETELDDMFMAEVGTAQPAADSQLRQDKELQTETIDTEDKHVQSELRAEEKEVQTEENNIGTEGSRTQTRTRNEENQEERATETEGQTVEVQTQTPIRHLEHLEQQTGAQNVNNDTTDRSPRVEMDVEKNHACPPPKELHTEEGQTENPETQTTQKHQEAEVEWSDSDNDQSHDGTEQVRPQLFPLHTVHQVSHDLSGHRLDLQDDHQPSVQITEGSGDQSEPGDTSEEDKSITLRKSVVSSKEDSIEDRVDDTTTGTGDLCPPQQLPALTQGQQFLPSSDTSDVRDANNLASHSGDISASSSERPSDTQACRRIHRTGGGRKRCLQRSARVGETTQEELSSTSPPEEYERCHHSPHKRRFRQYANDSLEPEVLNYVVTKLYELSQFENSAPQRRSRQQRNRNRAAGSQSGYTREPRGRTRETQGDSRQDHMMLNLQQEVQRLKADVRTLMEHRQQQNDDSSGTGNIQDTSEPESLSEPQQQPQQLQQQQRQQQQQQLFHNRMMILLTYS